MYDASKGRTFSGGESNLAFGLMFIGVVAVAFCIAFFVPFGSKNTSGLPEMSLTSVDNVLLSELDDPHTKEFFTLLAEVDPEAALDLEIDAEVAVEDGATKNELVLLMFNTMDPSDLKDLSKSNVKYFDAILKHARTGLNDMSRGRSKWCKGSTYEKYADMSQYRIMKEMENTFGYDSDAYAWGIQLNSIILKARLDGQRNPVNNGKLTSKDEAIMQSAMMKLIADPQIMQLMMISGQSKREQKAALNKLDMCKLGGSALGVVMTLPADTRKHIWGEMASSMNDAALNQALSQMGGF